MYELLKELFLLDKVRWIVVPFNIINFDKLHGKLEEDQQISFKKEVYALIKLVSSLHLIAS